MMVLSSSTSPPSSHLSRTERRLRDSSRAAQTRAGTAPLQSTRPAPIRVVVSRRRRASRAPHRNDGRESSSPPPISSTRPLRDRGRATRLGRTAGSQSHRLAMSARREDSRSPRQTKDRRRCRDSGRTHKTPRANRHASPAARSSPPRCACSNSPRAHQGRSQPGTQPVVRHGMRRANLQCAMPRSPARRRHSPGLT